jgi:hypothetical protein
MPSPRSRPPYPDHEINIGRGGDLFEKSHVAKSALINI